MKILGIDPGTAIVGWAMVTTDHGIVSAHDYGFIGTEKEQIREQRLLTIYRELTKIITNYQPDCMSVEELFFSTNAKTAIAVGEARGVILLAGAKNSIPVISYSPLAVKRAITGDGKADKIQVASMIKSILRLNPLPQPDDVTDALAIALTHAYSYKMKKSYL